MTYGEFFETLEADLLSQRIGLVEYLQDVHNRSLEYQYRIDCRDWASKYFGQNTGPGIPVVAEAPYPQVPMLVDFVYDAGAWSTGRYYTVAQSDQPVCDEIPKPTRPVLPPGVPVFKCSVGDDSGRWLVGIKNSVEPGTRATNPADGKEYTYTVTKGIFGMPLKLWMPVGA